MISAIAICGGGALRNGFVSDDHVNFERGRLIREWSGLLRVWAADDFENTGTRAAEQIPFRPYRPLLMSTFLLDHAIWGAAPFGFHLTNLILHLLASALVLTLARKVLASQNLATTAALIFGLHPVTAEAWIWASGRADILVTIAIVSLFLLLERQEVSPGKWSPVAIALLALAACFAKETAALAVFALAVRPRWPSEPAEHPATRLRARSVTSLLFAAVAVYLVVRTWALGAFGIAGPQTVWSSVALILPTLLGTGSWDLVLPHNSAPRLFAEDARAWGWAGLLLAALVVLAAVVFRYRRQIPLLVWSLVVLFVCVAPTSMALAQRWDGGGRYFYLGLALSVIPLCGLVASVIRNGALRRVCAVGYVLLLVFVLQPTLAAYASDETLAKAAIEEFPERSHGWAHLGRILCQRGTHAVGTQYLERALLIAPDDARPLHNLAVCRMRAQDAAGALAWNQVGQFRHPGDARFWHGAALSRARLGDARGALREARTALGMDPGAQALPPLIRELEQIVDRDAARGTLPEEPR